MSALQELVHRGGPAVVAIIALSVVLYTRCFGVLLGLRRGHCFAEGHDLPARAKLAWLQRRQGELRSDFRQERITLGAMIAAAPLLGLLGTVSGMVKTFESLSSQGQKSMEGLAGGISEVLDFCRSSMSSFFTMVSSFANGSVRIVICLSSSLMIRPEKTSPCFVSTSEL